MSIVAADVSAILTRARNRPFERLYQYVPATVGDTILSRGCSTPARLTVSMDGTPAMWSGCAGRMSFTNQCASTAAGYVVPPPSCFWYSSIIETCSTFDLSAETTASCRPLRNCGSAIVDTIDSSTTTISSSTSVKPPRRARNGVVARPGKGPLRSSGHRTDPESSVRNDRGLERADGARPAAPPARSEAPEAPRREGSVLPEPEALDAATRAREEVGLHDQVVHDREDAGLDAGDAAGLLALVLVADVALQHQDAVG